MYKNNFKREGSIMDWDHLSEFGDLSRAVVKRAVNFRVP
jgi:hypothetical protein